MKTLIATTGGRPLKNEDAKLFEQILTMIGGFAGDLQDGLIMSGVNITGTSGNYDISAGYIYYSGSICTFNAVAGVSLPYVMEKFEVDGTPREHFDASTKDTINLVSISAQTGGGYSLSLASPRLSDYNKTKTEIFEIGDWNMDANSSTFFAHGLTFANIRSVSALIRNDTNDEMTDLSGVRSDATFPAIRVSPTNIILQRETGSYFDNNLYDSTSYNRGWVTVEYIV